MFFNLTQTRERETLSMSLNIRTYLLNITLAPVYVSGACKKTKWLLFRPGNVSKLRILVSKVELQKIIHTHFFPRALVKEQPNTGFRRTTLAASSFWDEFYIFLGQSPVYIFELLKCETQQDLLDPQVSLCRSSPKPRSKLEMIKPTLLNEF